MKSQLQVRLAGIMGALGVILGALGAHKLHPQLVAFGYVSVWETAVLYHLVHSAVLLALALAPVNKKVASFLFSIGIVIFSGSLYVLALTNTKWLGAITPIGGACLIAGWICIALTRLPRQDVTSI